MKSERWGFDGPEAEYPPHNHCTSNNCKSCTFKRERRKRKALLADRLLIPQTADHWTTLVTPKNIRQPSCTLTTHWEDAPPTAFGNGVQIRRLHDKRVGPVLHRKVDSWRIR